MAHGPGHLYALQLGAPPAEGCHEPRRVTQEAGHHSCALDAQFEHFVDTWSSAERPFCVQICALCDGAVLRSAPACVFCWGGGHKMRKKSI